MKLELVIHLSHEDGERLDRIAHELHRLNENVERIADHVDPLPKSYITWTVSEQPEKKE